MQVQVLLDQRDQLDAIHARHVHVGDHQVVLAAAHHVPAVDAVDRHVDVEAARQQQLALHFAHRQRIVDDEDALGAALLRVAGLRQLVQAALVQQFVDRQQQIGHVEDQYRLAVVEQGGGGNVAHLAEDRIDGLHRQALFAADGVDHQRIALLAAPDHHHRQIVGAAGRFAQLQHLRRRHQAQMLALEFKELLVFQGMDGRLRHAHHAFHLDDGDGVGLALDVDHQRAHDRLRQRQGNQGAKTPSRLRLQAHRAVLLAYRLVHDIEAHAASGQLVGRRFQAEGGQEQKFQQLARRQRGGHGGAGHLALDDGLADFFQVDAAPVVADLDAQHAGAVARFHAYRAQRCLAGVDALVRTFHAMVDGIPQHVVQRAFDLRQDVAVDQRVFAVDLQLHFLAQAARQVAHHARERVDAVAERAHAQR